VDIRRRSLDLAQEKKLDVEEELEAVRKKVNGLRDEPDADEALGLLEEAVTEIESIGERLEEAGS
jgi:exonuclease VII small subunit